MPADVQIGPNDRCPCGSGQKYKRCCMPKDQAASASPPDAKRDSPDVCAELVRLTNALRTGDLEPLYEAIDTLGPLLEAGGPLAELRFEAERFEEVFLREAKRIESRERGSEATDAAHEAASEELARSCVEELVKGTGANDILRTITGVRAKANIEPTPAACLDLWHAVIAASFADNDAKAMCDVPLLAIIVLEQGKELMEQRRKHEEAIDRLAEKIRSGSISSPDEMIRALQAEGVDAESLIAKGGGKEALRKRMDAELDRLPELFTGSDPIRALTVDEYVFLSARVAKALHTCGGSGPAHEQAKHIWEVLSELGQGPLGEGVRARLAAGCDNSKPMSKGERERRQYALFAARGDPASFLLEALKAQSIDFRPGEEQFFKEHADTPAGLDALARKLQEEGRAQAAECVRLAREMTVEVLGTGNGT